jgi:putative addiction module killer protein
MKIEIKQTEIFRKWRMQLKDERARALIASSLDCIAFGHMGDVASVECGISELRIHYGPGSLIQYEMSLNEGVVSNLK